MPHNGLETSHPFPAKIEKPNEIESRSRLNVKG
jgi:hypothetical protein